MTMIEVNGLTKRYGDKTVVDDISFTVAAGEIFGILGPNGAGKTTTVECIEGLRTPDSGTITVAGLDPQLHGAELKERLGVQLQSSELQPKITVAEAMKLYSSYYRDPVAWRALIEELHLTDKLDTQFRRLSGGQKQRLSIALALVGNPEVAVLDELTTGLDPQARRDTWGLIERIRDLGVTIVLVTHFMEEAERLCDRLAVIDAGRLVALDTPSGLVARIDQGQRIRFRPSGPLDVTVLKQLEEVTAVDWSGQQVVVTGTGNLLFALTTELARHHVVAGDLRVEQVTLDDAFVALTGRRPENEGD